MQNQAALLVGQKQQLHRKRRLFSVNSTVSRTCRKLIFEDEVEFLRGGENWVENLSSSS